MLALKLLPLPLHAFLFHFLVLFPGSNISPDLVVFPCVNRVFLPPRIQPGLIFPGDHTGKFLRNPKGYPKMFPQQTHTI